MRLFRKAVILGLAAFGAYRIYELVRPQAGQLASTTTSQVGGAVDTMTTTATKVKDDVSAAKDQVVGDLQEGIDEERERLRHDIAATAPGSPADTAAPQVGLG